jgi:hypothetical protein
MTTRRKTPLPKSKDNRLQYTVSSRRQSLRDADILHRQVVVFETTSAAQEIIRVSIETASHARQQEPIIAF